MAHKLLVKDTVTGQCGLADPPVIPSPTAVNVVAPIVNTGTPTAPVLDIDFCQMSAADFTCLRSAQAGNAIVAGTDGKLYTPVGAAPTAVSVVAPIINTGTPTAPILDIDFCQMSAADFTCLRSAQAGNLLTFGTDGKLYVAPRVAPAILSANVNPGVPGSLPANTYQYTDLVLTEAAPWGSVAGDTITIADPGFYLITYLSGAYGSTVGGAGETGSIQSQALLEINSILYQSPTVTSIPIHTILGPFTVGGTQSCAKQVRLAAGATIRIGGLMSVSAGTPYSNGWVSGGTVEISRIMD